MYKNWTKIYGKEMAKPLHSMVDKKTTTWPIPSENNWNL